jgi:hypothetical protein
LAHQMFNISAEAKKYPKFDAALGRAFPELEGALFWTIGEMGLLGLPERIIKAAEKGLDGTDAEKEGVMIGALLTFAPVTRALEGDKFGPEATAVVKEIDAAGQWGVQSEKAARATAVAGIALMGASLPMMEGMGLPPSELAAAKKQQDEADKLFVPQLNAPKLEALFSQAKQEVLEAMASKPGAKKAGPRAPGM